MKLVKSGQEINTLKALYNIGQSPWYDNIDRRLIKNGGLEELFNIGIVGVTSNPTIFQKAISGSDIYDRAIYGFINKGLTSQEIYDELTTQDVRDAADMLIGVYKDTHRVDGYVSIEVLPDYAHDVKQTIDYARYIFRKVNRPNIMIKVPGTKEAPEAIRQLISEGINVNVTLLFSVEHYEAQASAFIKGLRDRIKRAESVDSVASVASVFVSRIDTKIDKLLDEKKEDSLKGKTAVANSKLIYQCFKELFSKENFGDLTTKRALVQRPLWASTSRKNPAYSDCLYVDELIGSNTINTMPQNTIEAFLDHGKVNLTLEKDIDEAEGIISRLKSLGIDINQVCQQIQDEGVRLFADSFNKLIESIKTKMH